MMRRDIKLDVPYFSQFLDVGMAEQRPRACGMVCAYMVLNFFGAETVPLDELIAAGERDGGYSPAGWVHNYLVKVIQGHGFSCERREKMSDNDVELFHQAILEGNPVIVSVARVLFDQRDFHMVVLTGVRENEKGEPEGFFYHNPWELQRIEHRYVPIAHLISSWRRMAILPKRSSHERVK